MKIRNFEYFASRVARKFDTIIQRSLYNYNGVWFANGMYMDFDGEFLYISECSNGVPTTVMSCFVYCYNTQKDFFHDLDLLVSCNSIKRLTNTTAEETTDTTGEDITENTEQEETEETSEAEETEETAEAEETEETAEAEETKGKETEESTASEETYLTETAGSAKRKADNQAYNSMCYNCKKFLNGCRGEKNKIYSGCVYKEKMEVRNNG